LNFWFLNQGTSGFGFLKKKKQSEADNLWSRLFPILKEPMVLRKELANQIKELPISELVLFF
jgi:hypothetical protein